MAMSPATRPQPPPPMSLVAHGMVFFSLASVLLLCSFLLVGECGAHVALTYPPARRYDLDFLDNIRTLSPCGMPKGEKRTSLMSGSVFNVTWHLAYPHRGGYKLELLNDEGKPWMDLTPTTGSSDFVQVDTTAQRYQVRLPQSLSCAGCTIRLKREATEWANNYTFWSCADVDILQADKYVESCFGHGDVRSGTCVCERLFSGPRCQYKDECWEDKDCGEHGKCVDVDATSFPKKQCYCQLGWFGDRCKTESPIKSTELNLEQHHRKDLSQDFILFWRILKPEAEIEIIIQAKTTTYVSIGWRPKGTTSDCKAFPSINDNVVSSTEIEGIAESALEPSLSKTSHALFTPAHSGNATEVHFDEERLIEGTAEAVPYDESKVVEGRTVKNASSSTTTTKATITTTKATITSTTAKTKDETNSKLMVDRHDMTGSDHAVEETVAESKGHLVTIGPSIIAEAEGPVEDVEEDHSLTSSSDGTAETAQDGEVVYGFNEGQVEYSFNVHTTTTTTAPTMTTLSNSRVKRQSVHRNASSVSEPLATFKRTFVRGPHTPKLDFHPMDCTDIVTGMVRGTYSRVRDQYTRDRSTPREDSFWGGRDSLTAAGGFEEDGLTTVFFRRSLAAADDTDHSILKGQMHVIWAKGQDHGAYVHSPPSGLEKRDLEPSEPRFYRTDEFKYHGHRSQRGVAAIDFLGEVKHRKLTGNGGGEFKIPSTCSVDDCEYRATWEIVPSKDEIIFTVSTNNSDKWTGIGFSTDTKMPGTDAILGWVDDSGRTFVMDTWIDGYSTPILDESQDVFGFRGSKINGKVTLMFKRKRDTGDTKNDLAFTDTTCLYLVFPHNGGVFNAVNKKIRQHAATPIVSDTKICIDGTSSTKENDDVSSHVLASNVAIEATSGSSAPVAPSLDREAASATTVAGVATSSRMLSEYLVAIRLPNQTLGDAVERGIDFEMLIMEHLKVYMTDALKRVEGFEKVDVTALESEKNESRVVAKLRVYVDRGQRHDGDDDDDNVGHPARWSGKTEELRQILNETIVKGRVGRLVVDPSYLVVQPPAELAEDFAVSVNTKIRERGADNETMLVYVLVAAVSALGFLLIVLIICTICRSRSARKARLSKERLIAAGGWKDYAATTTAGVNGYGYENFGVTEETPKGHNKHSMQMAGGGGSGSTNGTPRGSSGGGFNGGHHARGNGYSETRSLHRNSKGGGVVGASTNDRHYTRRSESLPRPMGVSGASTVEKSNSRPSSATSLHPQGHLQPDFYFMPSQRRYSGEVVRVYVDYNNPNYTGK